MATAPPTHRPDLLAPYLQLPQGNCIQAEYVWIDGDYAPRCKSRTLPNKIDSVSQLPNWDFDGSSTNQAPGNDSDVLLRPAAIYKDPFRGGDNILVLASTYNSDGTPNRTNHRHHAQSSMELAAEHHPWFGLEQEYTLIDLDNRPLGWPARGFPAPQGPYYCGAGAGRVVARDLVEAHYRACLYAGIKISGINAEVMPSQWEFQVGPCEGISMGDELWMARYILIRLAEQWNAKVSFHPKPLEGDWNGAGCHTNYSTEAMRQPGGMKVIEAAIEKLAKRHDEHIAVYGDDNDLRLTGRHETGHIGTFSSGVANRGASIRVPRHVNEKGYGYLEDRRPASNIDPYKVTKRIIDTTILDHYKDYNTPARLGELTEPKLAALGVSDKVIRGRVLSTLKAAGFRAVAIANAKQQEAKKRRATDALGPSARNEVSSTKNGETSTAPPPLKKRKRDASHLETNEFLPGPPSEEGATLGSLDFHEILDEDALMRKSAIVNRAPVMMAWSFVVAERLGFSREEALSIASVYTEMNAISKGVSLGLYDKKRETDLKAAHLDGSQPYVNLLGRRVPLYRSASGAWRAFTTEDSSGGGGGSPGAAYGYITRALRQTAPAVLGAMRLLAESYSDPMELNRVGFALYINFRPEVTGWGKRGELRCEVLLALRKKQKAGLGDPSIGVETGVIGVDHQSVVKYETSDGCELVQPALDGDSDCNLASNDPLDDPFDDFTIEELSALP